MYKVGDKEYSHDSSVNQDIKRKFVKREVLALATMTTEYILKKGWEDTDAPFSYDDVENVYQPVCPECGEVVEEVENDEGEMVYKCEYCDWEDEDEPDTQPQEIYEWWLVTDWFAKKLRDMGEPILVDEQIWGRTCTGQAILLDWTISQVCEEMGILEGQEHDWSAQEKRSNAMTLTKTDGGVMKINAFEVEYRYGGSFNSITKLDGTTTTIPTNMIQSITK